MAKTSPKSGTAPGPDASAPAGPAASARPPGAARRAPRHRGRRRGGADSAVDGGGGDAAASTSTGHEAYSSAPAHTEPATPEAATRNPDDEYTQPDGSRMSESHCTVVKMVGVQEPSHAPPVSLHRAPVQVVLSGRVANSSGGQQAQCAQVRLSRPHGRLTSRPPLRHRHHRPHCQPHHVAALGGAARVKPPTTISWAMTTTLTTAAKPLSLVVV